MPDAVDTLSPTTLILNYLQSKGLPPNAENIRRTLMANASDPSLIPGLRNDVPGAGGADAGNPKTSGAVGKGGNAATRIEGGGNALPVPPIPPKGGGGGSGPAASGPYERVDKGAPALPDPNATGGGPSYERTDKDTSAAPATTSAAPTGSGADPSSSWNWNSILGPSAAVLGGAGGGALALNAMRNRTGAPGDIGDISGMSLNTGGDVAPVDAPFVAEDPMQAALRKAVGGPEATPIPGARPPMAAIPGPGMPQLGAPAPSAPIPMPNSTSGPAIEMPPPAAPAVPAPPAPQITPMQPDLTIQTNPKLSGQPPPNISMSNGFPAGQGHVNVENVPLGSVGPRAAPPAISPLAQDFIRLLRGMRR
jgi:hypothetical protein